MQGVAIRASWIAAGLLVMGVMLWSVSNTSWQAAKAQAQKLAFIYAAKYVCAPDLGAAEPPLVSGIYKTAVNVHNFLGQEVKFTKKVAMARGQDEPRGPISDRETVTLKLDEAVEIDCLDIAKLLKDKKALSPKGFVVIESPVELDVVAVYTSQVVVKERDEGFTCWNKVLYFEPPIVTPPSKPKLEPLGQREIPLPNKVHEIVLPCPPPPKDIKVDPANPDRQTVPPGVNSVTVVNNGPNPIAVVGVAQLVNPVTGVAWPGGTVPVGGSGVGSVTSGGAIGINAVGGQTNVKKTYGINHLQAYVQGLTGNPNIVIAKKIIDIERSNKVIYVFKTPLGRENLAPVQPGKPVEVLLPPPPEGLPINLTEAVRSAVNEGLGIVGKPPLVPEVSIEIIDIGYGVGKGVATVGPEVEMGLGQGVGVGVGAGISIDVEYIQPKRVER
jgi:hypothetical protein